MIWISARNKLILVDNSIHRNSEVILMTLRTLHFGWIWIFLLLTGLLATTGETTQVDNKIISTQEKMNAKLQTALKSRDLDYAVMSLFKNPDLIKLAPIETERLLLCWWERRHFKNLTAMLDMLVESGHVVTVEEFEEIVMYFLQKGFKNCENIHKYVQYLNISHGYKLPLKVWKEYLAQNLLAVAQAFEQRVLIYDSINVNICQLIAWFNDIYINVILNKEVKNWLISEHFEKVLEELFSQLEMYINLSADETERNNKLSYVFKPFMLSIINQGIPLYNLLSKNEVYRDFIVKELVAWSEENSDFFKTLFLKIDFKKGKFPWSVFKCMKDAFKQLPDKNLYFFLTRHFMENFDESEEVSEYCFSKTEYKELVKYFLNSAEVDEYDKDYRINEKNEEEYLGFVIID